ncbi:hypothetical protein JTB14_003444 [Gonioctena quinquepunctata]|nr:hypothetical protein JTB14_003444 [Gonioctena quinquepunctata]
MDRRASNFSNEEIEFLLSLVDEFKDVVECKKSDTVLWKDKEAAWANISKKLVEIGFPPRTTKQLRDKWGNLKKETKKKYGDEKVESFKTGGGPKKVIRFTPLDDKIKSIIGVAVTGDSNPFDSDTSMRDYTGPQDIADCQNDKHMAGVEELKEEVVVSSMLLIGLHGTQQH